MLSFAFASIFKKNYDSFRFFLSISVYFFGNGSLGRPVVYRTVLDSWHWFCNAIGLYEPIGFHVLRHTFAHTALRGGIPVKVVSAWLGHADVSITLNIYDSVDDVDFRNAAVILEDKINFAF